VFGIFDLTFSKIVDPTIFVRESFIFAVTFLARRAGARRVQFVHTSPPIVSRVARPCRPRPNFSAGVRGGGGGGRRDSGLRLRRQVQGEVVEREGEMRHLAALADNSHWLVRLGDSCGTIAIGLFDSATVPGLRGRQTRTLLDLGPSDGFQIAKHRF